MRQLPGSEAQDLVLFLVERFQGNDTHVRQLLELFSSSAEVLQWAAEGGQVDF